ncbi:dTDP-4-dehydrorhamnose reductase [Hugenholtzia roseola]|uniref:dTDP-4-dehydrorhamnose reductase n=1 Tax=Hugenholtzia roseola TaxID=1002 RepID=UPI000421B567|nr:dTDP-4-dehydrorhamnose reductase [Hugenholtzia roseola]
MILITGSRGQLGQELKALASRYPFEYNFTDSNSLDVRQIESIERQFALTRPRYCINAAAYTAVDMAESEKMAAYQVNVLGAAELARVCQKYDCKLLHISTDFVFDGKQATPYAEDAPVQPLNVYGNTKWQGERQIWQHNPQSLVIRTSWLYSPFGKNFVKTMRHLGRNKPLVRVVQDQIGSPTYAKDLAETLLEIILFLEDSPKLPTDIWRTYHYTNEGVASWYDFAQAVFELSQIETPLEPIKTVEFPTPAQRPAFSVLDKTAIKDTFKLYIPHWRESLRDCIRRLEKEQGVSAR